jgi:histone deacetylase 1/2
LQTDNGKEFDSIGLRLLFSAYDIQLRLSCPYTSQQNGKAERVLCTLNDFLCTMLLHSAAPLAFWAEVLATMTYLINRHPRRATGTTTPFSLLFGVAPTYNELHVFGYRCFPNIVATSRHKLNAQSAPCIFIGYPVYHRGYRCYNITLRWVILSHHVIFDENVFPFRADSTTTIAPWHSTADM